MMSPKTQTIIATTTITLTASIAISLIPTKHEASIAVLITLGIFVITWNAIRRLVMKKNPDLDWYTSKTRHEILFAIILASLLILGSMIMTVAKLFDFLEADTIKRIIGINTGLMLVVLGNYMPKKLQASASQCGCFSNKPVGPQRFLGWTFVLGGLLYTLAWIMLDLDQAGIAVLFSFPVAILLILGVRFGYRRFSSSKPIAG